MYRHILLVIVIGWLSFDEKIQACNFDCGKLKACISLDGVENDCRGFLGCYEECPTGSVTPEPQGYLVGFSKCLICLISISYI